MITRSNNMEFIYFAVAVLPFLAAAHYMNEV